MSFIPGDNHPVPPLTESGRQYLKTFLEQVRRADLPGAAEMIERIEWVLSREPGGDDRPDGQLE